MRCVQSDCHRIVSELAATASWRRKDVLGAGCELAVGAVADVVETGAAHDMLVHAAAGRAVPASPSEHGSEHGPQLAACGRELVEVPPAVFRVGSAFEDAILDQPAEPVREDGLWNVQVGLQSLKRRMP